MSADAGPEHTAKRELTQWLYGHGIDVYWEESNPWNYPTFSAHGTGGKPDMILRSDEFTLVCEFKPATSTAQLYDATLQTHRYWRQISTDDMRLRINGEAVSVDGVLTASGESEKGRLFPAWADTLAMHQDYDEGRKYCSRADILPHAEFRMTEQHTRTLWRLSKRDDIPVDEPPYIGALLSTNLDKDDQARPAVLWNEGSDNQNWEVIA